jgi:cytochrome c oxidase subunit II
MKWTLPLFPEQASSMAGRVDALYFFLVAVTIFFSVLIAALEIYFAIKYRRRSEQEYPEPIEDSMKLEFVWIIIPFALAMVMFVWGASVYFALYRPPQNALEIYVVAKQWMWKFQHLDGQREINELHVPVNQ